MDLNNEFIKAGLNEKEAIIYLAALELGPTSVLEISKKTDLKRPTIYEIIPSLLQAGLLSQTADGNRRRFVAESPEKLFNAREQELNSLRQILPLLESFRNTSIEKPILRWFEGKEAIQQVLTDMIHNTGIREQILAIEGKFNAMHQKIEKDFLKKILREKKKRGLESRTLIAMTKKELDVAIYKTPWSFDHPISVRLIKDPDNKFKLNLYIYQNKITIVAANQLFALTIQNELFAQSFTLLFEILWGGADQTKVAFSNK